MHFYPAHHRVDQALRGGLGGLAQGEERGHAQRGEAANDIPPKVENLGLELPEIDADEDAGYQAQVHGAGAHAARKHGQCESGQNRPVEYGADFVDGLNHGIGDVAHKTGGEHAHRHPKQHAELRVAQVLLLSQGLYLDDVIFHRHGGHCIDAGADRRHGRRENGHQHQSDYAVGQVVEDEQRQHLIGLAGGNQGLKSRCAQHERANGQPRYAVGERDKKPHNAVEDVHFAYFGQAAGGQGTLHLGLVAAVVRGVEDEAPKNHGPEPVGVAVQAPAAKIHRLGARDIGVLHQVVPAAQVPERKSQAHQDANIFDKHLNDIGVHHHFQSALERVEHGDDADDGNGLPEIDVKHAFQNKRYRVDRHARSKAAAEQKQGTHQPPRAGPKPVL